ncbi:hypothetical protein ACFL43_07160 [Thermodesulfobacteriota bacterium]
MPRPIVFFMAAGCVALLLSGCMTRAVIRKAGVRSEVREQFFRFERALLTTDGALRVHVAGQRAGAGRLTRYVLQVAPGAYADLVDETAFVTLPRSCITDGSPAEQPSGWREIPVDNVTFRYALPEKQKLRSVILPVQAPAAVYLMSSHYCVLLLQKDPADGRLQRIVFSIAPKQLSNRYKLVAVPFAVIGDVALSGFYLLLKFWRVAVL